jgi:hypothetical protein
LVLLKGHGCEPDLLLKLTGLAGLGRQLALQREQANMNGARVNSEDDIASPHAIAYPRGKPRDTPGLLDLDRHGYVAKVKPRLVRACVERHASSGHPVHPSAQKEESH